MSHKNGTTTEEKLLIKRLKVSGLLSFGPKGIDLPMRGLNVLIGANGSGKSNFLEVLALLRAAPQHLTRPMKSTGGFKEWMWKPPMGATGREARIEVTASSSRGAFEVHHRTTIGGEDPYFELLSETVELDSGSPRVYYNDQPGTIRTLTDIRGETRSIIPTQLAQDQSILSQVRDPEFYPALTFLQDAYTSIRLFRNWSFGPNSELRKEQSTHDPGDFLQEGGQNLALVLSNIHHRITREFRESLRQAYSGLEYISFAISGGTIQLFLEESGGRLIPASRLSDGILRYLCLLAILLHPEPPPLIGLDEPELGLHPDLIHHLANLLKAAARRTQLVVTTHSRLLIDEMTDQPESVVICEKEDGESSFERLDAERMKHWLDRYSLGELWSIGELGGNRW
jgi:predicted ATPase